MKNAILLLALLVAPLTLRAAEANGLRVEARKTTLENNDQSAAKWSAKVDQTLGIKLIIKNIGLKEFPEGKINWIMLVERWGRDKTERFQGTDALPALKVGQQLDMVVGESQIGGYQGSNGHYQDKLAAWQVTFTHDGKETLVVDSGSAFARINKSAKDAEKDKN